MKPEKNHQTLTRWLLIATIALLVLVLGLQLWQIFGRKTVGGSGPAAPEASQQQPASQEQAPAAQQPASQEQAPQDSSGGLIGEEAAKDAAFAHAGVTAPTAVRCDLDWEDGRQVYEIEFWSGATEYEYEVDASTGSILKAELDR